MQKVPSAEHRSHSAHRLNMCFLFFWSDVLDIVTIDHPGPFFALPLVTARFTFLDF
jgi:hypothetical protein